MTVNFIICFTISLCFHRALVVEAYTDINNTMQYYRVKGRPAANYPFNFWLLLLTHAGRVDTNARTIAGGINYWLENMPVGETANWVVSFF